MKTVVTEILEELKRHGIEHTEEQRNKYLETEKQQIIDAYEKGVKDFANYDPERHGNENKNGLEHYTSTFGTNKETLK